MPDIREVKINGKFPIMLPEHRAARPEWYTQPYWEEKRIDSLILNLSALDTLYYVGAEEGDIAALCQMYTKCQMVLFEPNHKVWPNMRLIWESNSLTFPKTFDGFASNITTSPISLLNGFPYNAYGEVISDHGFKELCDPGNIPQIKIDDVQSLCPPTAIAMDCEGSEWQILKGAEQTLRALHPKLWISVHPEFMFRIYGQYQAEMRHWIRNLG
jgi:FkbM family methyltransferase